MPIWRLWLHKEMSLNEIRSLSYIDVMKANAMLDMQEDMDAALYAYDEEVADSKGRPK